MKLITAFLALGLLALINRHPALGITLAVLIFAWPFIKWAGRLWLESFLLAKGVKASHLLNAPPGCTVIRNYLAGPVEMNGVGIVTNPPFRLAEAFIRKAISDGCHYHAWLLRTNFLESVSRLALWREHPPSFRYRGAGELKSRNDVALFEARINRRMNSQASRLALNHRS